MEVLRPSWKLNREKDPQLFGPNVSLGEDVVHVLVVKFVEEQSVTSQTRARSEIDDQRPVKRVKATEVEKWKWKEEEQVYYRKGRLFFVNREKAVQDLVKFHEKKFLRAKQGFGELWVIPLLDNVFGLGKSTFGQEYIRRCQSLDRDSTMVRGFMDTLCSCHTIRIVFNQDRLLDENGDFQARNASRSLISRIRAFFKAEYGSLPRAFDEPEENYEDILTDLTEEVGPLFIVIDEIGLAFNHNKLDDFARREQFIQFCEVLQPLFENQKLFFLIAGRASFLNYVARRPLGTGSITTFSPFDFKRLDLHLLRPEAIKTIIENTRWEQTSTSESIKVHLQLTNNQVMDLSARLFETTFGHPRSLSKAFKTCESYDELFNYVPDVPIKGVEWNSFFEKLWLYRNPLEHLMDRALDEVETDLSECWTDNGGTQISYETTVSEFGIGWEGNIHAALLYMPSYIQKPILAAVYPFKDLLEKVAPAISHISIDYPDIMRM
ncbi:hypothetical protein V7S43_008967 [Phytophthora oleae]|uniref:Uncharacterized protein n=1 Tax=Phytophthora oleae TaxID=2107226 RepID=A0ABD3FGW8_9STRA